MELYNDIKDDIFICFGCSKKCELVIENQNIYFEKSCALDNVDKWKVKE